MSGGMKIGDLAKATACSVPTIRYYEREGLLPTAARSTGNYRMYGQSHVEALRFIRHCRSLDMTHDEIRTLLAFRSAPDQNCREVNVLLDEHIGHVAHRIRELRALERELRALRGQCNSVQAARDCGIMQSLGHDSRPATKGNESHGQLRRTHR